VLRCERCGARVRDLERVGPDEFLPCSGCGFERLRPDVVWFEEVPYHLEPIEDALCACTHFLSVGTSGVVYPAAGFLRLARERGARTFVQALEQPENVHPADAFVRGRAAEVLPLLVERLTREWGLGA
jgi:NAD-dependent deacetylase